MNTLNKQGMAATVNCRVNTHFVKATAIAALFLASTAVSAQPRELESSQSLMPFTAASVGIAKKAENSEQAAEQEQQALALLQQAAPAKNVTEAAAAAVKSLAPALSSK
ncbi:hypothetical protein G3503_12560, partial [Shewanella baltica]|nr:hypothetical protein [Shewanella baltica]